MTHDTTSLMPPARFDPSELARWLPSEEPEALGTASLCAADQPATSAGWSASLLRSLSDDPNAVGPVAAAWRMWSSELLRAALAALAGDVPALALELQYVEAIASLPEDTRNWVEGFVGGTAVSFTFDADTYLEDEGAGGGD